MTNLVRADVVHSAQTIVVKVGTNVLTDDNHALDLQRIASLSGQIQRILQSGRRVVLVSSGAIGAGMSLLNLKSRPEDLSHLQAAAATGQAYLIRLYDDCFRKFDFHAAQILVTANDFKHRTRYLNVRNTLRMLFEYNTIPVVNENDTVSVDEIRFGDNDRLAAMLANLLPNPLLILLSSVDGLLDGPPGNPQSRKIPLVESWDDKLFDLAAPEKTFGGSGGMLSKLEAVKAATAVGESVILADGRKPGILDEILSAKDVGTLFLAQGSTMPAWKRWIGFTVNPAGSMTLDEGAVAAIQGQGKSLLAAGITAIDGQFESGEVVGLLDPAGSEFARGLSNYSANESRAIMGHRTQKITAILGHVPYAEVIHRDNLVLLNKV